MSEEHRSRISPGNRSDELIIQAFARLDRTAFGTAVGALLGTVVLAATVFVVSRGGPMDAFPLQLLAQYYPGYTVTLSGALVGFAYSFVFGFFLGWSIALIRNAALQLYLRWVQKKTELSRLSDFLDGI